MKRPTSPPAGALPHRGGGRRLILGGWLIYALVYAGFAFAAQAWHVWGLFLVYGVFFGLTEGAEKALMADLAGPEQRGAAFGLYSFTLGIAALPASALMGLIWHAAGAPVAFLWGAGLALLAFAALALMPPDPAGRSSAASRG